MEGLERPLVSIVMAAYNYAHFLREAIDSVLAQDYPRVELIVIDDGSTDNTRDVLASYGDRFWWTTQPNAGLGPTVNRGFEQSTGDLVAYLHADDAIAPGAVTAAVDALQSRPDAVMSYCDFAIIDVDSREAGRVRLPSDLDLRAVLLTGYSPFGPGSFVRRAALKAVGGWDPMLTRVPDFDYSLRLARLGAFVHVPRLLSAFRLHEQSKTFAAPPMAATEEAIGVVERFYAEHDVSPEIAALESEALAMAHMTVANGHFRARRWGRGLRRCAQACWLHPRIVARPVIYRLVLTGVIGQFIFRSRLQARRAANSTPTRWTASET